MSNTLSIQDFESNQELFHKSIRMIIHYLKEMNAQDETFDPAYEIQWLESVLAGTQSVQVDADFPDALLVPAADGEGVMLFYLLYRDEALIERIYAANREQLMLDEREISMQDFKDAVLHLFNTDVDEFEAEELYYSLRFEGLDMAHFCLYKDENLYVGFAAFDSEEDDEDEDDAVQPELN
jgi:hypothetical protein